MIACHGQAGRPIRSLFVSDVHLGCRNARAEEFLDFLRAHEPEQLYLVGDIIDGRKLRNNWRWLGLYDAIFRRLIELSQRGTQLYYTPGNHDSFLRNFEFRQLDLGFIEIADEFVHRTTDGRRLLVTHGDYFDRVENEMRWLSAPVAFGYDVLLAANRFYNRLCGHKPGRSYAFSAAIKSRVKQLVRYLDDFEKVLADHAINNAFDGIVCGHIHKPSMMTLADVTYYNTGDWVEHCTALAEYDDGSMELLSYEPDHPLRARVHDVDVAMARVRSVAISDPQPTFDDFSPEGLETDFEHEPEVVEVG